MDFTLELLGERLIALLSRYNFNSPEKVDREIKDQDMPWIFLLEEKNLHIQGTEELRQIVGKADFLDMQIQAKS